MSPEWVMAVVVEAVPLDDDGIEWCPCCGLYPVPGDEWRCLLCRTDDVPHPMEGE